MNDLEHHRLAAVAGVCGFSIAPDWARAERHWNSHREAVDEGVPPERYGDWLRGRWRPAPFEVISGTGGVGGWTGGRSVRPRLRVVRTWSPPMTERRDRLPGSSESEFLSLQDLISLVETSAHAFDQQQYRGPIIAHGVEALTVIAARGWLCDPNTALFASQVVREIGRTHRDEATDVLRRARGCATDTTWARVVEVARDLNIASPVRVGSLVPSYSNPDRLYHVIADRLPGTQTHVGGIYLSECGWVFDGYWVEQNIHRLDAARQQRCYGCSNAMAKSI